MTVQRVLVSPLARPAQKGDVAIGLGALRLAQAQWRAAEIVGVASFLIKNCRESLTAHEEAYGVRIVPWPLTWQEESEATEPACRPSRNPSRVVRGLVPYMGREAALQVLTLLGQRGIRALRGHLRGLAEAIAGSDLLIIRGGGYIASPHLAADVLALRLSALYLPLLARALRVPYAIWGHTIWDLNGPLSKRILWPVIRDSVVTACREEMSLRYLLSAGAPADKLVCLPDTTFALEPAGPARARHLLAAAGVPAGTPTMGLTVRPWYFIGSPDRVKSQRQYLVAVAKTVDHLFRKYGVVSILVRQNFSAYPSVLPLMEDDTSVYPDLLELVTEPGAALVLEGDYTVPELISLYGEMDLVLTTRLHAGIMASLSGTPSVAIAYNPYKTRGIMHMLGLNEWVLDIDNLQADDLIKLVEKAWESRFVLRDTIREAMPRIKGALAQYAELTAKGLMTTGGR